MRKKTQKFFSKSFTFGEVSQMSLVDQLFAELQIGIHSNGHLFAVHAH